MKRLLLFCCLFLPIFARAADYSGAQFIGFSDFSKFIHEGAALVSPIISADINWDELILSWNLRGEARASFEARVIFPETTTSCYQLGVWSARERHSITNQADEFATVALETLIMKRRGGKVQARIKFTEGSSGNLGFLAFSFADAKMKVEPLLPNHEAWGKTLRVPILSQLNYPNGQNLCSPTGCAMALGFWARQLHRRELSLSVPETAKRAFDSGWPSAGNWTFNAAVAGHFPGMRSYVARLTDISELEDWIAAGIPVATSVSLSRLEGENKSGSGHLVVCVGFDKHGDVIVNDPGTRREWARRTFARERFRAAWADSNNTVYLTYPEGAKIPASKLGHWE